MASYKVKTKTEKVVKLELTDKEARTLYYAIRPYAVEALPFGLMDKYESVHDFQQAACVSDLDDA
jgi:hypothetical protein